MLKNNMSLLAVVALFLAIGTAAAQSFTPIGDPEKDKRNWLAVNSPAIVVGTSCNPVPKVTYQAMVGGVLWPTLIQVDGFLSGYGGPIPLCITGGSEPGHTGSPTGYGHSDGFKVDLRIVNLTDTYDDPLSDWIIGHSTGDGCRGDGAPLNISSSGVVFALEFPVGTPVQACAPLTFGTPGNFQHWDVLSSYNGIFISPSDAIGGITLDVGQSESLSPGALDSYLDPIPNIQPWMFLYLSPDDPDNQVMQRDMFGNITGVGPGTATLIVSGGQPYLNLVDLINCVATRYCQEIPVQITAQNPPPGGAVCPAAGPFPASGCWQWTPNVSGSKGGWVWFPGTSGTGGNDPPAGAPVPGQCSGNSSLNASPPGCWVWFPNYGPEHGGAWVFFPPSCGSCPPTTTSPPISTAQSKDPNAISGPTGTGPAQYISGVGPTGYAIFFENEPTATAAADQVVVTNVVDPTRFDLTTLTLGPITFPGYPGVVPPAMPLEAAGQFSTQVTLTPSNLLVNVIASLNPTTGLLTWILQTIDPTTGLPPSDPSLGVLPPGQGGSLTFTAKLLPSLPNGSVINDQAKVTFDANAPISTAVWSNTLDATPPTSHVNALPSTESAASFMVSWLGTDAGSGVKSYTIYVSDSGGPFTSWLTQTQNTSANFIGSVGHTYGFYSIATDNVGNVEAAKINAEATTTVSSIANVTSNVKVTSSGFLYSRTTKTYNGTVTVTNISGSAISGPLQIGFSALPAGVTLANATTTNGGVPYITLAGGLAAGKSASFSVQFSNPSNVSINYSPIVYSGAF